MTEQLCAMCGAPKSEHAESRPVGAPVPRNGCGSLLCYFRPKKPTQQGGELSDEATIVIEWVTLPPLAWFTIDWTVAADKWVATMPGRTIDTWCELPTEWRSAFASHECALRRARGVPDPSESRHEWAFKQLQGMRIDDPGPSKYDREPFEEEL